MGLQVSQGILVTLVTHLAQHVGVRRKECPAHAVEVLRAETNAGVREHDVVEAVRVILGTNITLATPRCHGDRLAVEMLWQVVRNAAIDVVLNGGDENVRQKQSGPAGHQLHA